MYNVTLRDFKETIQFFRPLLVDQFEWTHPQRTRIRLQY